jgi:acyl-ACP thioesterase
MADIIYRKEFTIHTYELDLQGLARPVALLHYLQDAAGDHAAMFGLSVPDLFRKGLTWVLSRYHVLFHGWPRWRERVTVETWPSGLNDFYALRDFIVRDAAGGVLLAGTSSWMIISLERKKPVKLNGAVAADYLLERRALEDDFAPLPVLESAERELRLRVPSSALDLNRHVNNAHYIEWALESAPEDVLLKARPAEVEVAYRAEAFFGDEVAARCGRASGNGMGADEGQVFLHQIVNLTSGAELTRLRTRWLKQA